MKSLKINEIFNNGLLNWPKHLHSNPILVFEVIESSTLCGSTKHGGMVTIQEAHLFQSSKDLVQFLIKEKKYYLSCAKGEGGEINVNFG
jgi:hypothetical protein